MWYISEKVSMVVILVDRHEAREVEHQEKAKWIRSVLEKMAIPLDEWPESPSMDNLRKMRVLLHQVGIDIIDDNNDGIEIYWQDELKAVWRKPFYKLVTDPKERNTRYKFYYELHLRCDPSIESLQENLETNEEEDDESTE